jgi:hypothetical protein
MTVPRDTPEPLTPYQLSVRVDRFASEVHRCIFEGEQEGWVSGLPPDAAQRLRKALDDFCGEFGYRLTQDAPDENQPEQAAPKGSASDA